MKKKTLEALELSVKKWKRNVRRAREGKEVKEVTTGRSECPLCVLFNSMYDEKRSLDCVGCPVYKDTKRRFCAGTPFEIVFDTNDPRNIIDAEEKQELLIASCKDELKYLKSLLPKT